MGLFRTILAIAVLTTHSGPLGKFEFISGQVAVESFFMISGFYMTLILSSKYVGKNSYKLFITNRFLRIYPVYWVVLISTILICIPSGLLQGKWGRLTPYIDYHSHLGFLPFAFLVINNLAIFGQDIALFLAPNIHNGTIFFTNNFDASFPPFYIFIFIPQAWTLSLELFFYLIAPLFLRKNIRIVLFLILASLLVRFYVCFGLGWNHDPWTLRFFPVEIFFFLLGNISYRIYEKIKDKTGHLLLWGITISFLLITLIYHYIPLTESIKPWAYYCVVLVSLPYIFNLSKNSKIDNRIGELSYPIYIVHVIVIEMTNVLVLKFRVQNLKTLIAICLTVLVSYALLKFVVDPIDKFRQLRWSKQSCQ